MATLTIRTAAPEDAAAIARVHVAAWRAAYANIVPQAHLDQLSTTEKTSFWQRILLDKDTAKSILVAARDSTILGFASYGPDSNGSASTGEGEAGGESEGKSGGELRAIYVDPAHWSQGVGRLLCHEVFKRLASEGFERVVVWVFADNIRSVRFYGLLGFEESGRKMTVVGGKALLAVGLRNNLVGAGVGREDLSGAA